MIHSATQKFSVQLQIVVTQRGMRMPGRMRLSETGEISGMQIIGFGVSQLASACRRKRF